MDGMVKRKQQVLKYYRYCIRKARELMRSELRKAVVNKGRKGIEKGVGINAYRKYFVWRSR